MLTAEFVLKTDPKTGETTQVLRLKNRVRARAYRPKMVFNMREVTLSDPLLPWMRGKK